MVQPESRHVGGYLRRQHERVSELDRASGIQEERFYRGIGQDADQGAREVQTRRSLLARQGSLGRFVADVPFDVYGRRGNRRPLGKGPPFPPTDSVVRSTFQPIAVKLMPPVGLAVSNA